MKNQTLKYGVVLVALGLIIGISIAIYLFNKPKRDIAKAKVEYSITAAQLVTEFTQNEHGANAKYLSAAYGKVIQITGIVKEINLTGDSLLNLSLRDSTACPGSVNCSMEKPELSKAMFLRVGDKVTIKGECTGYMDITNEVTLIKCSLKQ